ncbi:YkgJ family cysteine cluster protein [Candidatus Woesearchaeota archaeon]|nr:YkgJ family cysteine cluster protein [Candidatus Woesearchaeota archaeon]
MISRKTPLKKVLKLGKSCKCCGHCCSFTSGTLLDEDVKRIAKFLRMTEEEFKNKFTEEQEKFNTKLLRFKQIKNNKPYGKCIFLKNKRCKIHEVKPLHCRVANCGELGEQLSLWFTVNYFINKDDPESIRQYEIFLRNNKTIEGAKLSDFVPDKKKLKKIMKFEHLR